MSTIEATLKYYFILMAAPLVKKRMGTSTGSSPRSKGWRASSPQDVGQPVESQIASGLETPARSHLFADYMFEYQWVRTLSFMEWGGATVGECLLVADKIDENRRESWEEAWSWMAARLERSAEEALGRGHVHSARSGFLRAYNYYRAAEFFVAPNDVLKHERYLDSLRCFRNALPLMQWSYQHHAIPFENTTIPIHVYTPSSDKRRNATIILLGGGDASGEELYFWGAAAALARGYTVVTMEGPGQRGFLYANPDKPFRIEYEEVMRPVIDFIVTLDEVDESRIALYGLSLGGLTGARIVACEPRLSAFIANSPMTDFYKFMMGGVKRATGVSFSDLQAEHIFVKFSDASAGARFASEQLKWIMGADTIADAVEKTKSMRLNGLEREIKCPVFCLFSVGEGREHYRQFREFTSNLRTDWDSHIFDLDSGADLHCQVNNLSRAYEVAWDWLDDVFNQTNRD